MYPRSLIVLFASALVASAYSPPLNVAIRQVSCNETGDWSDWQQNCCGESVCPSAVSCTAGQEGCTSSKVTLSITWTQIVTTTTMPGTIHTSGTVCSSTGTSSLVSTRSFQPSASRTTTGTHPATLCSSGTCIVTSLQGPIPPNPTPQHPTTDTNSPGSSTEHSMCHDSSCTATTATPLDTSMHSNSDATASISGTTSMISMPGTTTNTGLASSASLPSSSSSTTHHSTTTPTSSTTGFSGSGAERLSVAMAAVVVMLSSVIIQAILL